MSQSATLYRVSQETFQQLKNSGLEQKFQIESAKNYYTFQGTFMGLEFILSKGKNASESRLINEIFTPNQIITKKAIENLSPEEQWEMYDEGSMIAYLDPETISSIQGLLDKVSEQDLHAKYDAQELNSHKIYPWVWNNDTSPDIAFNERHLLEDLGNLKTIFKQAVEEKDFIIVFVG